MDTNSTSIGSINESSLHKELKLHYAKKGFIPEEKVLGFVVDLKKDDKIIEIQTGNFSSLRKKLNLLLPEHQICVVYPIALEKWIVRLSEEGEVLSKRRSPKKGEYVQVFNELVYLTDLLLHPHLMLELVLINEEEIRLEDGKGSWRRKGVSIKDHNLLEIKEKQRLTTVNDYLSFLPKDLPEVFTNKDISAGSNYPINLTRKMTYTLKNMQLIEIIGKRQRERLYQISGGGN